MYLPVLDSVERNLDVVHGLFRRSLIHRDELAPGRDLNFVVLGAGAQNDGQRGKKQQQSCFSVHIDAISFLTV